MNRRRYVRAMLNAIDKARTNQWDPANPVSKADGLRVIRDFERINQVEFNPFDRQHVERVSGLGWAASRLRGIKKGRCYISRTHKI